MLLIISELELEDVMKNISISIILINEMMLVSGRLVNIWNMVRDMLVRLLVVSVLMLFWICFRVVLLKVFI